MSSIEESREFVRLTAAEEELLGAFNKTVVGYGEEMDNQRKQLEIIWKPVLKLHRIDRPQRYACKEDKEEVPVDQWLYKEKMDSSMDQEDPEPPQVKEEQEELYISQEGEHLVRKQETDTFMMTPTCEEKTHSEDQTLHIKPEPPQLKEEQEELYISQEGAQFVLKQETNTFMMTPTCEEKTHSEDQTLYMKPNETAEQSVVNMPVMISVVGAAKSDLLLLSNSSHVSVSHDKRGETSEKHVEFDPKFKSHCRKNRCKKTYVCSTCGKVFSRNGNLKVHTRIHTGEKPYCCKTCGKLFRNSGSLVLHMRTHSSERPYCCKTCVKYFKSIIQLTGHMKIHSDEKPFNCKTCGKNFRQKRNLIEHVRTHTDEKPYSCNTCGKHFKMTRHLARHMQIHTDEKPYCCKTCGRQFKTTCQLKRHMKIHSDEKPYCCKTCGKQFRLTNYLSNHMRIHTSVNPNSCKMCGRHLRHADRLMEHMRRVHTGQNL